MADADTHLETVERWSSPLAGSMMMLVGSYRLFVDGPTGPILAILAMSAFTAAVGWKQLILRHRP